MKNIFFLVTLFCILNLNSMSLVPCGTYRHDTVQTHIIDGLTIETVLPYKDASTDVSRLPENCLTLVEPGTSWATFPLNPCVGVHAKQIAQKGEKSKNFFAHLTYRTHEYELSDWLKQTFNYIDPRTIMITLYTNAHNEKNPTFAKLNLQKSQTEELIEQADDIVHRLSIPAENITVDLVEGNRLATMKRFTAHYLAIDESNVRMHNGKVMIVGHDINSETCRAADTRARDISRIPLALLIDHEGSLYNTRPSALMLHTQRNMLANKKGQIEPLYTIKNGVRLYDIPSSDLTNLIIKKYYFDAKTKSEVLYNIYRCDSPAQKTTI